MTQTLSNRTRPSAPHAAAPSARPSSEQITARAKKIWESKGRPVGQDVPIWLEAEAQLIKEKTVGNG